MVGLKPEAVEEDGKIWKNTWIPDGQNNHSMQTKRMKQDYFYRFIMTIN